MTENHSLLFPTFLATFLLYLKLLTLSTLLFEFAKMASIPDAYTLQQIKTYQQQQHLLAQQQQGNGYVMDDNTDVNIGRKVISQQINWQKLNISAATMVVRRPEPSASVCSSTLLLHSRLL